MPDREWFTIETPNRPDARVSVWTPEGAPRAIVQIFHGMAEHIDRYDAFATMDIYGDPESAVPVCKIGASDFFFAFHATRRAPSSSTMASAARFVSTTNSPVSPS